jgi:nucleoid-associated protein YgaU
MANTRKDTAPGRKPAPAQPITLAKPAPVAEAAPVAVKAAPAFVPTAKPVAALPAMPFGRTNYQLMLAGIALIVVGFVIMGQDHDPFGFGFAGLTLGPIVVMAGFVLEFFAIMAKPRA